MNELDLVWLAGLLEGEGTFSQSHRPYGTVPIIEVKMTDLDVIERAGMLMGIRSITHFAAKENRKEIHRVRVSGKKAAQLMRMLQPHMGARRSARIESITQEYGH